MGEEWFFLWQGETRGPANASEIASVIRKNRAAPLLIWKEGMSDWLDAAYIPEFSTLYPPSHPQETYGDVTAKTEQTTLHPLIQTTREEENRADRKLNFFQRHVSKIETPQKAIELAKQGAICGLLVFASETLGLALPYLTGVSVATGLPINQSEIQDNLTGAIILLPTILFFCWRVNTGKGYISATLLLCLFLFEIFTKIVTMRTNVGWFIAYFFIAVGLFNGIRACWYLRKQRTLSLKS